MSRDREDGRATWHSQGVGSEAYLNSTSQGPTPEDARKDGHIRGRSKRFMKYSDYKSGRSAVWSAHLPWEQGAGGSNPPVPTSKYERAGLAITLPFFFLRFALLGLSLPAGSEQSQYAELEERFAPGWWQKMFFA